VKSFATVFRVSFESCSSDTARATPMVPTSAQSSYYKDVLNRGKLLHGICIAACTVLSSFGFPFIVSTEPKNKLDMFQLPATITEISYATRLGVLPCWIRAFVQKLESVESTCGFSQSRTRSEFRSPFTT
jgi:hypothetical protein